MWTSRLTIWRFTLCAMLVVSTLALAVSGDEEVPSESQCRPYIEKALKHLESGDAEAVSVENNDSSEVGNEKDNDSSEVDDSVEDVPSVEVAEGSYLAQGTDGESKEDATVEDNDSKEVVDDDDDDDDDSKENASDEDTGDNDSKEERNESAEDDDDESKGGDDDDDDDNQEDEGKDSAQTDEEKDISTEVNDSKETQETDSKEETNDSQETKDDSEEIKDDTQEESAEEENKDDDSKESQVESTDGDDAQDGESTEKADIESDSEKEELDGSQEENADAEDSESQEKEGQSDEEENASDKGGKAADESTDEGSEESDEKSEEVAGDSKEDDEGAPEEDLLLVGEVPENLRSRSHIAEILRLNEDATESEQTIEKSADIILRDLKKLYENSIKPLEGLYKYRDLSNRHFGDPEIFSKPLVLFMGPWSGGKSSILNYLTGLEFTEWSLRTGAEPSPAYFNILMHGKEPQVLDGTQLAADWTFSGLQKFGQGLEERLRGLKYPSKILEKVNIVEIPGILEVRKQVSRVFPFNDACQWFIDRADIIFLVYDPSKLDVGPETEAILDQLKGRESQTRIVLNKADTVKPEELMRVQSALIWNISPLMSSAQPPVMYTVSLWSMPFESSAPARLLLAQERELFKDLRMAIDKRIENKISSARRFAVRVRNHAKMVDCYLTTYYNHKTIFGNKKLIAEAIIENPQNYHIYEGLSTLTNISRYDLPDPETYRDFFRLNSLYDFQQLSATCTYFRGCPINRLDIAIAYDLPELVGKYKKMVETVTPQGMPKS